MLHFVPFMEKHIQSKSKFLSRVKLSFLTFAASQILFNYSHAFIDEIKEQATLAGYTNFGSLYFETQVLPADVISLGRKNLGPSVKAPEASVAINENIYKNWVKIPTSVDKHYYVNEFFFKDILTEGVTEFLKTHKNPSAKELSSKQIEEMENKGKLYVALFPTRFYQLNYFAGRTLIRNQKGFFNDADIDPMRAPENFKTIEHIRVPADKIGKTIGIFNGTYFNDDTTYSFTKDNSRVYGTIENANPAGLYVGGHLFDAFNPFLATTSLTQDGELFITKGLSEYDNADKMKNLQWARQNETPVLLNGVAVGAYPKYWNRYQDNILRSYLALSKDKKYFAYVWTNYATPAATAEALLKLGFTDAMLVDIHPVIACMLYRPSAATVAAGSFENKNIFAENQRFYFVPNKTMNGFQWNPNQSKTGSHHDFFSISEK